MAQGDDRALVLGYLPEEKVGFWKVDGPQRANEHFILEIPASYSGSVMEAYLAFTSADGEQASNSVYLGQIEI